MHHNGACCLVVTNIVWLVFDETGISFSDMATTIQSENTDYWLCSTWSLYNYLFLLCFMFFCELIRFLEGHHDSPRFQSIQIVSPQLHHLAALW